MYFSKWVAFTAALSIARASTDYCDEPDLEPDANDSTAIVKTSTTYSQDSSVTQSSQVSYTKIPAFTSVSTITASLTPASSATSSISANTSPSFEQSALGSSTTPTLSSEPFSTTVSIHNAEITKSEKSSTSEAIPSLTISEHATIRPAMALCIPNGGLCPSNSTSVATRNKFQEAITTSSLLSTITVVATSTQTVTSWRETTPNNQQTSIPPARRARRSCANGSQPSSSMTSQSVPESTSTSIDSTSQSQETLSMTRSSTLQSQTVSPTSAFSGTESTETPTSTSDVVSSMAPAASQAHSTTILTLYSTTTPFSSSSTSAAAAAPSHTSGSVCAFGGHAKRTLFLGLVLTIVSCLLV